MVGPDCNPSAPVEGSLNVCNSCASLLTFESGNLRVSSEAEVKWALADPAIRAAIARILILLRKARHMRS